MDVFTVGANGHILHTPWAYGWDNFSWNSLHTEQLNVMASPGAPIGAVAPYAGSIQVAARKADGTNVETWFENVERGQLVWQSTP
jgi:hypothetical protein